MSFNKYGVYSALSQVESNNNKEYEDCVKLVESMGEFSTKESVKEFLEKNWNYTDFSKKKVIAKDCLLSVKENKEVLVVTFNSLKEHHIYIYSR